MEVIKIDKLNSYHQARASKATEGFAKNFNGRRPDAIVRSPGRINLIGDHIDYHGFSVLPMAISNSIYLCCSFRVRSPEQSGDEQSITLVNSKTDRFPKWTGKHSLTYGKELDKSHRWENYFLCGYHGVLVENTLDITPTQIYDHSKQVATDSVDELKRLPLLDVYIDSDLPPASGMSSSSALVCASAIATKLLLEVNELKKVPEKLELDVSRLAESCSKYEHLIGTHGGGMDQAVIMTAQEGYAKFVEFLPKLNCENIRLPASTIWLVSHCGHDHPKAATSSYNSRVLETKLAACFIAKALGDGQIELDKTITLRLLKERIFGGKSTEQIVAMIRSQVFYDQDEYCEWEIIERLGISSADLADKFDVSLGYLYERRAENSNYKLLSRCEHVFEEAERVERFRSICDTTTDIVQLGQLMTQSHYSLRDKYECSHPALDRLVTVALEAGALGARLTGAGWGGCVVSLVEASKCETVMQRLKEVSRFTFRTEPQAGSQVIRLN